MGFELLARWITPLDNTDRDSRIADAASGGLVEQLKEKPTVRETAVLLAP